MVGEDEGTFQRFDESTISSMESVLLYLDDCNLECDGMTLVISHLLREAGIEHTCMVGMALDQYGGGTVFPHCWIDLSPTLVIDFRLRMWLGDHEHIPHGIFDHALQGIVYRGGEMTARRLDCSTLSLVTDGKIQEITLRGIG